MHRHLSTSQRDDPGALERREEAAAALARGARQVGDLRLSRADQHVRVGRPFRPSELLPPDTDRRTAKGLVTKMIMERIAALLPPSQRGVYGHMTPAGTPDDARTPGATEA